jgi:diacylglycerol O-acyltransferase / wax synthase
MVIERLTAADELMLWPDDRWPRDIGALVIVDGTNLLDRAGLFRIEAAREVVGRRLYLAPRFRQLLSIPPRGLGGPLWMDAFSIDLAATPWRRGAAPARGGAIQAATPQPVPAAVGDAVPHRADGRRIGLFVRMHHSTADGIPGVAITAAFLDADPDAFPARSSATVSGGA